MHDLKQWFDGQKIMRKSNDSSKHATQGHLLATSLLPPITSCSSSSRNSRTVSIVAPQTLTQGTPSALVAPSFPALMNPID